MKLAETIAIIHLLRAAYPSMIIEAAGANIPGTVQTWHECLKAYDVADVRAAIDHFRFSDSSREFAPGLFSFEAEVRKVVSERESQQRHAQALKWRSGGTAHDTFERVMVDGRDSGGKAIAREVVQATRAHRLDYHRRMVEAGYYKETYNLPGGRRGYRYVRDQFAGAEYRTLDTRKIVDDLCQKTAMPNAEREDYGERYEWGSVFENLESSQALTSQDDTPIGPDDFNQEDAPC